ncbi:hypothetical protein LTR36_005102 [Oleoguttula mirabilis]|uniref:Uncharacterized protein n=1 Tax=Oleoguttula mirabilis TaxID=1507867 RepID=A0AAV9JW15_9PEZI|nr:hypothetical protein LTR36_005102 [Oleoguttula mirabilis]
MLPPLSKEKIAPYDYQLLAGDQEKRSVPKAGFDHLFPPPAKRAKTAQDGDEVQRWIDHALKTRDELARERIALQKAVAEHKDCEKTIKELETAASRKDGKLESQRIAKQQADASLAECRQTIKQLENAASQASQQITDLQGQCNTYQQNVTDAANENNVNKQNGNGEQQLRQQLVSVNAKLQNTEQALASHCTPDATAEMQYNELREELSSSTSRNASLLAENERLQRAEQERDHSMQTLREKMDHQEEKMWEQEKKIREERKNMKEMQEQILRFQAESVLPRPDIEPDTSARLPAGLPTPPKESSAADLPTPSIEQQFESPTPAQQSGSVPEAFGTPVPGPTKKKPEHKNIRNIGGNDASSRRDRPGNNKVGALTKASGIGKSVPKPTHSGSAKSKRNSIDENLKKMGSLHQMVDEAAAKSPEPEDSVDEDEADAMDMSVYGTAKYLWDTAQYTQITRKNMHGGSNSSDDGSITIWFQKRDNGRVVRAKVTIMDLTPGHRKRFLPDPGNDLDDQQKEDYKVMCILAQFPEVQMEAARSIMRNMPQEASAFRRRMIQKYGTCSNPEEKVRHSREWAKAANILSKSEAFGNSCVAWLAKEPTTVEGAGPWPAQFTDPRIKYETSLQPELDIPEADKDYSNPLDDAATNGLSKGLDDQGSIDEMQGMTDRMDRRVDLVDHGGKSA